MGGLPEFMRVLCRYAENDGSALTGRGIHFEGGRQLLCARRDVAQTVPLRREARNLKSASVIPDLEQQPG